MSSEQVDHPPHYGGDTTYETIKVLRAWLTPEEYRGFLKGNAIKYMSREKAKGFPVIDLAKAVWYTERLREFEAEEAKWDRRDDEMKVMAHAPQR